MNIIRNIESATLLSIGALCAAAVVSLGVQSAVPSHEVAAAPVQTVTIVAKRMSAAEKSAYRAELRADSNSGHTML